MKLSIEPHGPTPAVTPMLPPSSGTESVPHIPEPLLPRESRPTEPPPRHE